MTSQKRVATRLPAKNNWKIWSKAMADECSFCAERRSTAIVRDDVILAHTDCREMDPCPIRAFFQRKAMLFFDKPAPKSNSPCPATSPWQKSRSFYLWVRYFKKNRSIRARRVVHWSPCRMFHASLCTIQSKKFCGDFDFLVTCYLLCMKMTSSCLRLSSFFLGLDTIIT